MLWGMQWRQVELPNKRIVWDIYLLSIKGQLTEAQINVVVLSKMDGLNSKSRL